jgi:hypothetical protein
MQHTDQQILLGVSMVHTASIFRIKDEFNQVASEQHLIFQMKYEFEEQRVVVFTSFIH